MSRLPPVDHEELAARLSGVVAEALRERILGVEALHQLSGGSSRETWSFDALGESGRRHPLILQLQSGEPGEIGIGVATEAEVLRAAVRGGVPVPGVVAASAHPDVFGRPFVVLARVEGETIPRRFLEGERFATARRGLARQYGEVLGRIQQVPLGDLPRLDHEHPLDQCRRILGRVGHPHPAFELGFRWLEANRPPPEGPVLVHGDFRNGNGIVGDDGLRAVIDWELAHLGDPMEDLGWLCLRAWRFGHPHPVGGFGEYGDLVSAYTSVTGRPVAGETLRWWMVLGTIRWGVICVMRLGRDLWSPGHALELAAIGRRVCEAEFDLLLLLP